MQRLSYNPRDIPEANNLKTRSVTQKLEADAWDLFSSGTRRQFTGLSWKNWSYKKLKHKQWRTVGVALTFNNSNSSKRNLWIDSLSQSWTNPMHLLQAFGSLTLSWSCLPLVCLWDCKIVSAPKFIYGSLRTCSSWWVSMIKIVIWYKTICFGFVLEKW